MGLASGRRGTGQRDDTRIATQAGAIWIHDLRRKSDERVTTMNAAANAGITIANYDVAKDGRFLMVKDDIAVGRLRVIQNWRADTSAPVR